MFHVSVSIQGHGCWRTTSGHTWDSVGMYNTWPSKKLVVQRKAYAQDIKNMYRILLARKMLLSERLAPVARKEHEIKIAETASLNSGQ